MEGLSDKESGDEVPLALDDAGCTWRDNQHRHTVIVHDVLLDSVFLLRRKSQRHDETSTAIYASLSETLKISHRQWTVFPNSLVLAKIWVGITTLRHLIQTWKIREVVRRTVQWNAIAAWATYMIPLQTDKQLVKDDSTLLSMVLS